MFWAFLWLFSIVWSCKITLKCNHRHIQNKKGKQRLQVKIDGRGDGTAKWGEELGDWGRTSEGVRWWERDGLMNKQVAQGQWKWRASPSFLHLCWLIPLVPILVANELLLLDQSSIRLFCHLFLFLSLHVCVFFILSPSWPFLLSLLVLSPFCIISSLPFCLYSIALSSFLPLSLSHLFPPSPPLLFSAGFLAGLQSLCLSADFQGPAKKWLG